MSTPHQGPGQWEPGNWVAATDHLANLNAQQQRNLQLVLNMTQEQSQKLERMLNKQPLRARIHTAVGNAVGRAHQVYERNSQRLSEHAHRGAVAADLKVQQVREGIGAGGRAIAEHGRQAVAAGKHVAGNVSRWFQDKKANAQTRAEAARASFAAFRMDPTLPQNVASPQERLELSQHYSKVLAATTPEAKIAAAEELLKTTRAQVGAQENAQNMSAALQGMAPAARATGPTQQAAGTDQSNQQGAVNLNKNQPNKGGPTIG